MNIGRLGQVAIPVQIMARGTAFHRGVLAHPACRILDRA